MPAPSLNALSSGRLRHAQRLEAAGDLPAALQAYEDALRLHPQDPALLAGVARMAGRLGMPESAADLWRTVLALAPMSLEALNGRARALAVLGQFDDAVELLRNGVMLHSKDARLWDALGVVLTQQGKAAAGVHALDEAVRLDPHAATAVYNRGSAKFDLGALDDAAADFAIARKLARNPEDASEIDFAAATLLLAQGRLGEGWDAYRVRLSPKWSKATRFSVPWRRWTPTTRLAGKHLLVIAEQGLGDEIMFANVLSSTIEDLGPDGRLTLAVEPRLVSLFARSFPTATVTPHASEQQGLKRTRSVQGLEGVRIDYWAPMASLPKRYRRALSDFPSAPGYLKPDPQRVAHWRAWLGEGPPAVGFTWRSGMQLSDRRRAYPPKNGWAPLLAIAGVRFVNLQYGDSAEEAAAFQAETGVRLLSPPGLNIHDDIDDLAALCLALDMVITVPNATGALAGAVGAKTGFVAGPSAWPNLGTDALPWYPAADCFLAPSYLGWDQAITAAAEAVAGLAASRSASAAPQARRIHEPGR